MSETTPIADADDLFADEQGDTSEDSPGSTEVSSQYPATFASAAPLSEVQVHVGRRGARLVLIMGEVSAGKSTLLVEMWTDFMQRGRVGEYSFAGSLNSLAFEQRAFLSRNRSGIQSATTLRTQAEDDGWLHLRTHHAELGLTEVFLSDMTGERFERVRGGREVLDEFSFTNRVDLFMVLIDGGAFADRQTRETTGNYAARLLDSLSRSPALDAQAQLCIVLTKQDLLDVDDLQAYEMVEADLLSRARRADPRARALRMAARPQGQDSPTGLEAVVAVISGRPDIVPIEEARSVVEPARAFGRYAR